MIATAEAQLTDTTNDLYADLAPAGRYIHRSRDEALLALLRRHGIDSLAGHRILEVGCARGALIRSLIHYGADPSLVEGVDINSATFAAIPVNTARASAAALPYRDASFDLAFMFTSLSSMRDDETRRAAADEALRVLRPGGLAVVYDFRLNPTNSNVHPVSEPELRSLFPRQNVAIERATLAPPLVRLVGGNEHLCRPLERLSWLRTHLLAAVKKDPA